MSAAATDARRWDAVRQRQTADFFYAVRSTGVFCRPGCSSRLPRRDNVEFFSRAEDAVRAGYRACKKCRPGMPPAPPWFAEACRMLEDGPELTQTAAVAAGMSARNFLRMFKRHAGVTPRQYAEAVRARRWRGNLRRPGLVAGALYEAGFNSSVRAYESPVAQLGMTPRAYKAGAPGERIACGVFRCAFGRALVAATARGVCAIYLGRTERALRAALRAEFPRAEIVRGEGAFFDLAEKVLLMLDDPGSAIGLPLDIRGTAFQQRVWRALQNIPPGKTDTYSGIAARIGMPRAARAVARAIAANSLAAAVPCHRVVGKDGSLRGYRWGENVKRDLLRKEATRRGGAKS